MAWILAFASTATVAGTRRSSSHSTPGRARRGNRLSLRRRPQESKREARKRGNIGRSPVKRVRQVNRPASSTREEIVVSGETSADGKRAGAISARLLVEIYAGNEGESNWQPIYWAGVKRTSFSKVTQPRAAVSGLHPRVPAAREVEDHDDADPDE